MITTFVPSSSEVQPLVPPSITFYALDDGSHVKAVDGLGVEVAQFIVEGSRTTFSISRLVSSNTAPMLICSSHRSSLTGNTTMKVHGQEVRLKVGFDCYNQTVHGAHLPAMGKLRWKEDLNGKDIKLIDERKQILAKANLKEKNMEVFVPGDEMMLDYLLAGWVALVKAKHAEGESVELIQAGVDAVSALAGGGGGGGGG